MTRFLIFAVCLFLVLAVGLSFHVENPHEVAFNYWLGASNQPLSLLLVSAVLIGAVLGVIASMFVVFGLRAQIRSLRKSESIAKEEVRNLRSIPIKDAP